MIMTIILIIIIPVCMVASTYYTIWLYSEKNIIFKKALWIGMKFLFVTASVSYAIAFTVINLI